MPHGDTHGAYKACRQPAVAIRHSPDHSSPPTRRRGSSLSNPNKGKWYKFNDTTVEPVETTDEFLEQECFGGTYKVKVSDSAKPKWGELRLWSGESVRSANDVCLCEAGYVSLI